MKESRENSQVKALYERAKKNKRLRTLVVALSVCVCLLTIGLLTKNAETLTIDTQYTDSELAAMPNFEQYIIGVTTQYKNKWDGNDVWHDLTPDTVLSKGNNEVKFQFDYVLSGGVLSNSNSVKYHLPDNLTITQRETGDVLNFYGQPVGSYLIDTDGLIVIEYNDEYVQRNRGGESIQGSLAFNTLVENIETGDDGSTQIHFKDNVVVNIETKEANEGKHDIKTVKSATSVDYANNTVSWKIDITSDNGTAEPVSVSDTMKEINITQGGNFVLKDKNGNTLNINNYGFSSTDKTFSLTLPQMAAGDKYTLEYVTKLDSTSSSGTVTTKNKVTVSSKDGRDRPIKDEHSVDKIVDKDILGKGGAISDDGQTISWTIEINPDGRDIGGGTINDTVLGQQLGYPDSTNFTVNINPPVNGQSQITFPFTFPAGTTQKYTITYSYPAYKQPGSQNIPNHVDFTWPNGDKENHDVSISAPPEYRPLDKHFVDKHLDGNGHATFDWTLNFNSNLGYMSPPTTIHDYVDGGNVDKQWFTYDQVEAVRAAVDSALSPYFSTGDYTFTPNFKFNGRYEGFDITFNVPIPMGVTFSINYQTTGTYVDGESNAYRNSAELKGVNNTVSTGDTKIEPTEPKVTKWDRRTKNQNDGSDTEHEYYDPNNPTMNGVMQWGVKLYIPENTTDGLTLNEFIPEDCVVQTNGLRVNAFNHDENITVTLSDDGQSYDVPRQTGNFYNRKYTVHYSKDNRRLLRNKRKRRQGDRS